MPHDKDVSNFLKYRGTKLAKYILPAIPVGADLTDASQVQDGSVGKIPGLWKKSSQAWAGFHDWSTNYQHATDTQLVRWQLWQSDTGPGGNAIIIPVCLNTREYIGVDIDTDDVAIANWLRSKVEEIFGPTLAVRRRDGNDARMVLFFEHKDNTAPITKRRYKFVDAAGNFHVLEILGAGQHVVIEGPHAKGAMQYWEGDNGGLLAHVDELPVIDVHTVDELGKEIKADAEVLGLTLVKGSLHSSSDTSATAYKIADVLSPHLLAPEHFDRLTRAIKHIDLDHPDIEYEELINLLRAIKASVGGDIAYFNEIVWPWCCTHSVRKGLGPLAQEQGIEWYLARWDSFHDSQLGPEHVYERAALCGYDEALLEFKGEQLPEIFGALPDDDDSPTLGGGGSGGGSASGSGSNGPLPFAFTDNAVADTFVAAHPEWRHTSDKGWVIYRDGVYVPNDMVLADISAVCVAVGAPFRTQGSVQAQIDMTMNNAKKHGAVERRLRYHTSVHADPADFDSDPWMLNTPSFIVDLRTGDLHEHAGQLMRQQTLVAPTPNVLAAVFDYRHTCPRFMSYLEFVTAGREHVIPFLQRWGAYNLVGEIFDQYLLFILGVPGTGKSTFADIIARLIHTYGRAVSKNFFMRQLEKRTFELHGTRGKRGLFADETPKGASWDEMLINSMLGGTMLSAEGKGRDFIDFRNVATLTVTGNHRPAFITHSEESGIDRRLLLLEMNKKIAEHMPDNTRFAAEVAAAEGRAILMWLVQGAMEGWQSLEATGSFLGGLEKPLLAQAKQYRVDENPFLEWIEDQMAFDAEGSINPKEAISLYRQYQASEGAPGDYKARQISRPAFRSGLENLGRLVGKPISYGRLTSGPLKDTYAFKGLRARTETERGIDPNAKVIDFFTKQAINPEIKP
jgi:P4 family phage/plasmid primase-like protien